MLGFTILSIFIILIVSIVIFEIRNEKKYQAKRRNKRDDTHNQTIQKFPKDAYTSPPKKEKKQTIQQNIKSIPAIELPCCTYPKFSHVRLVDMGLSDEESKEFIHELIPQLETHITLIEKALTIQDFHQIERLTHGLKGSATNLGTGGIADLLVEINTYLKSGIDMDIVTTYLEYLKYYTQELKEQYA